MEQNSLKVGPNVLYVHNDAIGSLCKPIMWLSTQPTTINSTGLIPDLPQHFTTRLWLIHTAWNREPGQGMELAQ